MAQRIFDLGDAPRYPAGMGTAIMLKSLAIDWDDLEIAFRDGASGVRSFLDTRTGEVVAVLGPHDPDAELVSQRPERFVAVPAMSVDDSVAILRDFVRQLVASPIRQKLMRLARGPGALGRCYTLLDADPALLDQFTRFEQRAIGELLQRWLVDQGVQPRAPRHAALALVV